MRLRHLLPIYSLIFLAVSAAAVRFTAIRPDLKLPLALAMGAVLLIQLGGQGLFTLKYAQRVVVGEDREAFLRRTVPGFSAVRWINRNLPPDAGVISTERPVMYLFDVPALMAQPVYEKIVDIESDDLGRIVRQMRRGGYAYSLSAKSHGFTRKMEELTRIGCAEEVRSFQVDVLASRTLPGLQASQNPWILYRLTPESCPLAANPPKEAP